jgi:quinol monooxygenase YgiN
MAYAVAATWRARDGEGERVQELLETIAPLCRAEPACRLYQAHRSTDDPREFYIYELYDDEAGFQAHTQTDHFITYVLGEAVPRLEGRSRAFYVTLD